MGRASRERCSLRTAKRPDPALPDESGKERTDETLVPINLVNPVELIVLSVKQKAARCRLRGSAHTVTLRAGGLWDLVPGEIAVVRQENNGATSAIPTFPAKLNLRGSTYRRLALFPSNWKRGARGSLRTIIGARKASRSKIGPNKLSRGHRVRNLRWSKCCRERMQRIRFSDPIIESNDRKDGGDIESANKFLMDPCQADLRCLDAHAHLGNIAFDHWPEIAIRHYEVGLRIGELSFGESFDGLLPWGWIDNRPFLRCVNGFGLCVWRLGRFEEAENIFKRMLWLNPSDNQGVRFLIDDVRTGAEWQSRNTGNQ